MRNSFRFRLVLAAFACFLCIWIVMNLTTIFVAHHMLSSLFVEHATKAVDELMVSEAALDANAVTDAMVKHVQGLDASDVHVVVTSATSDQGRRLVRIDESDANRSVKSEKIGAVRSIFDASNPSAFGSYVVRITDAGRNFDVVLAPTSLERTWKTIGTIRRMTLWVTIPVGILVAVTFAFLLSQTMLRPLVRLRATVAAIGIGSPGMHSVEEKTYTEFSDFIRAFNTTLKRLEASHAQAARFTANAAHEIMTPLSIMKVNVERSLADAPEGSPHQIRIGKVLDEIDRLESILSRLLLLSSIDSGLWQIGSDPIDVSGLLREAAADAEVFADGIDVAIAVADGIRCNGDVTLFQQMIFNILKNAAGYNVGDRLTIAAEVLNGTVRIAISNPSAGLPPGTNARVFERFYRGDQAHGRKVDGLGLGLSIAREIARAHDGEITFEATPDSVVTVTIILPAAAG